MTGKFPNPSKKKGKKAISVKESDVDRIICGVGIFVLLTIVLTFIIVGVSIKSYFFYSMEFKPGIYVFTSNGDYYYYPSGSVNTTLIVLGGGNVGINGWVYHNIVTVQPGYYSILVTPSIDFNKDYINMLPLGSFISMVIVMLLCRLASRLENTGSKPTSQVI